MIREDVARVFVSPEKPFNTAPQFSIAVTSVPQEEGAQSAPGFRLPESDGVVRASRSDEATVRTKRCSEHDPSMRTPIVQYRASGFDIDDHYAIETVAGRQEFAVWTKCEKGEFPQ